MIVDAKSQTGHDLPAFVTPDGQIRLLASLPGPRSFQATPFAAANPVIPRSDWVAFDRHRTDVPIKDQKQEGSCFPPGTRIRMADGSERKIEDLRLRDNVLTAEGNVGMVTHLFVRDEAESVIRLQLWGHNHLRMTDEHPVLTRRGYVKADELRLDDWVAMPRYFGVGSNFLRTANHVQSTRSKIQQERRIRNAGVAGRASAVRVQTPIPDTIQLNAATGRIFGLFLAEGNTDSAKVVWTFNVNETDTLVAELVELLREEWGVEPSIKPKPTHGSVKVILYGKPWSILFGSLCSTGSSHKRLHSDLTGGPRDFQEALLQGWLDGDGYERDGQRQGVTVSHDLALSMFDIAQAMGLRPVIRYSEPKVSHGVKSRRPRWDVLISANGNDDYHRQMDEKHIWRKVKGISMEDYGGPVYNFEVQGDNSYVAEGIGVHNCVANGWIAMLERAISASGQPHQDLSRAMLYAYINGGRDAGANPADAAQVVSTVGVCTEATVPYQFLVQRQISQVAIDEAKRFLFEGDSLYSINSWDELVSAELLGFKTGMTVLVAGNYTTLDSDGCPPAHRGTGNHWQSCDSRLKKTAAGNWVLGAIQSWGLQVWNQGLGYFTEAHWDLQNGVQAYAVKWANWDPNDPNIIPVVA